jgi:opacity protein-like surface antigen
LGFRRQVDLANGLDDYKRRINYFETPLSLKFTTGKFSVSGGAKVGFLNKASMTINEGVATSYTDEAYLYQKSLWSALVGFEYDFSRHFGLQLRYSFALNDIADHSANDGYLVTEKLYPNAFRFGLHYTF